MEKTNFGKINRGIVNLLSNENTHKDVLDYVNVIKESKTLQKEFQIYNNLETEKFDNESLAIKFIDENRKLIDFTKSEFLFENEKLNRFNNNLDIDEKTSKLYDAINDLITEETSGNPNPKKITSCYTVILESLLTPVIDESINNTDLDFNDLLEESIKIFNDKYSTLDENEKKLMNILIYSNEEKKIELFESCKKDVMNMLNNYVDDTPSIKSKIKETLNKTQTLEYSENNMIDIYRLYESLS